MRNKISLSSGIELITKIEVCAQKILADKKIIGALNHILTHLFNLQQVWKKDKQAVRIVENSINMINILCYLRTLCSHIFRTTLLPEQIPPDLKIYGDHLAKATRQEIKLNFSDYMAICIQNLKYIIDPSETLVLKVNASLLKHQIVDKLRNQINKLLQMTINKMKLCIIKDHALKKEINDFFKSCLEEIKMQRTHKKVEMESTALMIKSLLKNKNYDLKTIEESKESPLFLPQAIAFYILQAISNLSKDENEKIYKKWSTISTRKPYAAGEEYDIIYSQLLVIKKIMAPFLSKDIEPEWQYIAYPLETGAMPEVKAVARMEQGFSVKADEKTSFMEKIRQKVKSSTGIDVIFSKTEVKENTVHWAPEINLDQIKLDQFTYSGPSPLLSSSAFLFHLSPVSTLNLKGKRTLIKKSKDVSKELTSLTPAVSLSSK